jgi:Fur family iron response transcriptional regulator
MGNGMSEQNLSNQEVVTKLQAHGVAPTRQRLLIAHVLFARPQHLSAEQVLERVNQEGAAVSKATVYNTLNLFARKGLVREVIVDPSKVFYDSNVGEHHHMYNVDTGELTDIAHETLQLGELPQLPEGTVPVGVDVIIRVRTGQSASA